MNTYQRQLLDKLITELTANASPNLHAAQMIAAELKGAMQAQDAPQKPTPDADGWVENKGVDPECMIWGVKFHDNEGSKYESPSLSTGFHWGKEGGITHYKPA